MGKRLFKGRRQRVVLNEKSSDWMKVSTGVPHGSMLGPILFIIFYQGYARHVEEIL